MITTPLTGQFATSYGCRFVLAILLSIVLLGGCDSSPPISVNDFSAAETWGVANNVVGVKHLYFSGQPDTETLIEAHNHGVGVVIDLRESAETDWDEARAASDAGLTYYSVPIAAVGTSFEAGAMQKISTLVKKHSDQIILLHCSSGNRAGAWLAIHLVNDHGMDVNPSISLTHKVGLNKPDIEARVREYLGVVSKAVELSQ